MNALIAAKDAPYWLWGATLLVSAFLYAFALAGLHRPDPPQAQTPPGFTVAEPHVGQVLVIPLASSTLVSPCAAPDPGLPRPEQAFAEL